LSENEKGQEDKSYISAITANYYRKQFAGLPKPFWDAVEERVNSIE